MCQLELPTTSSNMKFSLLPQSIIPSHSSPLQCTHVRKNNMMPPIPFLNLWVFITCCTTKESPSTSKTSSFYSLLSSQWKSNPAPSPSEPWTQQTWSSALIGIQWVTSFSRKSSTCPVVVQSVEASTGTVLVSKSHHFHSTETILSAKSHHFLSLFSPFDISSPTTSLTSSTNYWSGALIWTVCWLWSPRPAPMYISESSLLCTAWLQ